MDVLAIGATEEIMKFTGKNVLVTGGGAGIGREIAIRFAGEGAAVFSADVDATGNAETARLIHRSGGRCEAITADVSSAGDVSRATRSASPVAILVNNAAIVTGDGPLHSVSEEAWDRVLSVCLKSVYLCSREVLPEMAERREGVILNISSVNALAGIHFAAYSAAKGAINSLTRVMAAHYSLYGIRINAICPGTICQGKVEMSYSQQSRNVLF
jgi:NAD(P)-dependent dehydrogenase (short-subunit alcohol dehydrogenase family)